MIGTIRREIAQYMRGVAQRIDAPIQEPEIYKVIGHGRTDPFFDCLVRLGYKPNHIVDVGANRGNWTRTALRYFPDARYTLFEPQEQLLKCTDLDCDSRIQIFAVGAGPKTSAMKLSTHERDDSVSFALTEEEAARQGREQVTAPVVALDEFLPKQGIPYPDVLKIDAEGWDLEVLKGAEMCAKNADVILLEAAVMNKFFRNKVENVVSELAARGFVLFDVTDLNRTQRDGALWLVELAFVKKSGKLDAVVNSYI